MKRVIIYARVSTKDQSTGMQHRELEQYVQNRGWSLIKSIEDKSTGTNINRSGFKELMKMCRERKADVVICWKLDRMFRSLRDSVNTLQEFNDVGVEFISLKDNLDMTTAAGRLMFNIVSSFSAFEADLIKARVRAGLDNAKANGKILGRPSKLNLEEIINLRAQGLSLSQIGKRLGVAKSTVSKTLSKISKKQESTITLKV